MSWWDPPAKPVRPVLPRIRVVFESRRVLSGQGHVVVLWPRRDPVPRGEWNPEDEDLD